MNSRKLTSALLSLLLSAGSISVLAPQEAEAREVSFKDFMKEAGYMPMGEKVDGAVKRLSSAEAKGSENAKSQEGLESLKKLATSGNVEAQLVLARIYKKGDFGFTANVEEAVKWMTMAAEAGNGFAQAMLSAYYWREASVKDPDKALKWAEKSAAQDTGMGLLALGLINVTGIPIGAPPDKQSYPLNPEKAVELFQKASAKGLYPADHMLAVIYANGMGAVKQDSDKAFEYALNGAIAGDSACATMVSKFMTSADAPPDKLKEALARYEKAVREPQKDAITAGDGEAAFHLAELYMDDDASFHDSARALDLYELAADQGNLRALYQAGRIYYNGTGVKEDRQKGLEYFKKGMDKGDDIATVSIAIAQMTAMGMDRDLDKGLALLKKIADKAPTEAELAAIKEAGELPAPGLAALNLGYVYRDGITDDQGKTVLERDPKEALKWFQKAAECGSVKAISNLGTAYLNGSGADKDPARAIAYMKVAAKNGDAVSLYNLSLLYEIGVKDVLEKDGQKSVAFLKRAADAGYPTAQRELGAAYLGGISVDKDEKVAFEYLSKATAGGDEIAKVNLAICYLKGSGCTQDEARATAMLKEIVASEYKPNAEPNPATIYHISGGKNVKVAVADYCADAIASCNLGYIYRDGLGTDKNLEEALKYFKRAIKSGHTLAYENAAVIMLTSPEKGYDKEEAVGYLKKAADTGFDAAQYRLGLLYEKGIGVEKDLGEAKNWYKKASDSGSELAKEALARLDGGAEGSDVKTGGKTDDKSDAAEDTDSDSKSASDSDAE
ncbi:MAG: sel1 repeat family protein [Candidatus Obscuribacterales bacterium]|nr:sel1 repeat family protein [Candidatus Obscuribacterales bacterium]